MRVLFVTRPFLGHLYPMIPLAQALQRDGHSVAIASTEQFLPEIERTHIDAVPAGLDPRRPPHPDDSPAPGYGERVIRSKVEDILTHAEHAPVDLLVREPTDFAAIFAAEKLHVPHVTLGRSQFLTPAHWGSAVGNSLAAVRRGLSLDPDPQLTSLFGSCYLDAVPAWFQPPGLSLPRNRIEVGHESYDNPTSSPSRDLESLMQPDIYVTFGTVYNRDATMMRTVLAGISGLRRHVLCTVGPGQTPEALVPQPMDGVTVLDYVPQSTVLPGCSLVVCHGGYSTVMGAISAGVPLVLIPRGSDHFANAKRCEELGVGVAIQPDDFSDRAVRAAASTVLTTPRFTAAARALSQRIKAGPPARFGARLLARVPALYQLGVDCAGSPLGPEPDRSLNTGR